MLNLQLKFDLISFEMLEKFKIKKEFEYSKITGKINFE